ncbi:5'-methylthioadenosine/adenosylhomocysteine nucleosidase [Solimicrobium silvestre]|uniref:adenosylhomocysteine nucleosidase n=1 Tax=Solimicrobium silvestre TaxID=2099400 RepID=A0A2S9GYC0_9BURK|nr:5'-methylthioadenosine/adenosylhomocysteine nucleosidase [Solimicrobium silvestre]PRC92722.1 MTA/SAH-Nsdase: MTA/SAH nucleosidase [Solimicrobium silvestre]
MTIGIMAAIHDEIAELIEAITQQDKSQTHHIGMRDYYVGELEGQACVLVLARMGKVAASATAVSLIREFGVSEILFSGLAGGLAEHVQVGDVVVADRLIQHDMDARPFFPQHEIPLLGVTEFVVSQSLREELQTATRGFFKHDLAKKISAEKLAQFGLTKPDLHVGMIASGDQFIGSETEVARLRKTLPTALAVEMEGAAVAQICHEHAVPCAILRTISDRADSEAHIDFNQFLVGVASHYSCGIMRRFLANRTRVNNSLA